MELVNIQYVGKGVQSQDLSQQDKSLVTSNTVNSSFGFENDYIELYIYGESGDLLQIDYNASDYYPFLTNNAKNNTYSNLLLDPEKDLRNRGYNRGNVNIQYNFYTKLFNSEFGKFYWIKEISTSRLEIKLASQTISDSLIQDGFNEYQASVAGKNYYPVFYLNFGNNQTALANNVAYTEDDDGSYLLIKLYEPLSNDFDLKSQLWIVDKLAESVSFNISIDVETDGTGEQNKLRGPNYNVVLNTKNGQTTPYYNYDNLLTSELSSSYQKLRSYYQDKGIQINVDYSNFSNFVHFSSAVERVNNFVYKLQLIENANNAISEQQNIIGNSTYVNPYVSSEQQTINNIIKNFDTYEYFLYFESSSWAWPKSTNTQPYSLYSVTSSQVSNFLGGVNIVPTDTTQSLLWSASYYDATNKDILHNSIPQYLLDDPSNEPYITFVDMIGQHFDNIWIYYKDVTNRYNATNNPNTGISLDLVSDALKGLGFNLYTNSNVSDNLYYTLFGINPDGSLLPPTGSEIITNYVTSSLTTLPAETIQDELYKRVYHNLPYLLKSKGTVRGVKALISTFGIPDTILTVREFGGNFTGSLDGIIDLNTSDYKVAIVTGSGGNVTGSQTLSSSLLSPYTTLQYYKGDTRLNNTNIEVGFSPSDIINNNITASQGTFSLDQLIGSPGYQYSASYTPLVSASNAYFASYTQPNSVWEYIRLLKFYNNTLFKTIKDFVPARTNLSTGIIVKSHMYERNKYPRHEPSVTFNDFSQSIDIGSVTGSSGGAISGSTAWSGYLETISGSIPYSSSDGIEKYNGEFSGSNVMVTNGKPFDQQTGETKYLIYYLATTDDLILETEDDQEFATAFGETSTEQIIGPLYQNISSSVKSEFLIDLDYNSDQIKPVNYNPVTYSLSQSSVNKYQTYTNPNNPFAPVQDFNYYANSYVLPRYEGSKTISTTYNTYVLGDESYGKTAAIDKGKYQYAYLVDIYTASVYFPNRSNAQIKYLIDNDENVLDLTKINTNIFEIQNVFKSGESVDISLFEYDELNPYSQQLADNPTIEIYEGGWRYLPILHNVSRSSAYQQFDLSKFIESNLLLGGATPTNPEFNVSNYILSWWAVENEINDCSTFGGGNSNYSIYVSASYVGAPQVNFDVKLTVNFKMPVVGGCTTPTTIIINIPNTKSSGVSNAVNTFSLLPSCNGSGGSVALGSHWPPGVDSECPISITAIADAASTPYTYYQTQFTSSQSCIYYLSQSNEILFNTTMSYYYYYYKPFTFSSSGDIDWSSSLDPAIFPFDLQPGDKISLYNNLTLGWDERFEYTIKSGPRYIGANPPTNFTSSVMAFQLSNAANLLLFTSGSGTPTESISGAPHRACRYIIWKHVPDETNVILKYNPKSPTLIENGLLLPQYIDPVVRANSGNVIKSLKQQNLIIEQVPQN